MTKGEQARLVAWRSKIFQQAAGEQNVARVCRHFGISRKSFYKWKRRHAEHGDAGLCDRPRTPKCSPRATARAVVSKILYLRQHYHFGPGRNDRRALQQALFPSGLSWGPDGFGTAVTCLAFNALPFSKVEES